MSYIIYNEAGEILRVIQCSKAMSKIQAKEGEFMIEGEANDVTQKVVNGKVVNKTLQETETDNHTPPEISKSKKSAMITNEQWQKVLKRLRALEKGK